MMILVMKLQTDESQYRMYLFRAVHPMMRKAQSIFSSAHPCRKGATQVSLCDRNRKQNLDNAKKTRVSNAKEISLPNYTKWKGIECASKLRRLIPNVYCKS